MIGAIESIMPPPPLNDIYFDYFTEMMGSLWLNQCLADMINSQFWMRRVDV